MLTTRYSDPVADPPSPSHIRKSANTENVNGSTCAFQRSFLSTVTLTHETHYALLIVIGQHCRRRLTTSSANPVRSGAKVVKTARRCRNSLQLGCDHLDAIRRDDSRSGAAKCADRVAEKNP
jgi:hypothetical protein